MGQGKSSPRDRGDHGHENDERAVDEALSPYFSHGGAAFVPKRGFADGSRNDTLHRSLRHAIRGTLTGVSDMRQAVMCPRKTDENEWIAVNTVHFFNAASIIFQTCAKFCTEESCPMMSAGPKFEYLWADGVHIVTPIPLSAPKYISYLFAWIGEQISNPTLFPGTEGASFSEEFRPAAMTIFKRLFRLYAHIYYSHYKEVCSIGVEFHIGTCFKHFIFFVKEFKLVPQKELLPLKKLILKLVADEIGSVPPPGVSQPASNFTRLQDVSYEAPTPTPGASDVELSLSEAPEFFHDEDGDDEDGERGRPVAPGTSLGAESGRSSISRMSSVASSVRPSAASSVAERSFGGESSDGSLRGRPPTARRAASTVGAVEEERPSSRGRPRAPSNSTSRTHKRASASMSVSPTGTLRGRWRSSSNVSYDVGRKRTSSQSHHGVSNTGSLSRGTSHQLIKRLSTSPPGSQRGSGRLSLSRSRDHPLAAQNIVAVRDIVSDGEESSNISTTSPPREGDGRLSLSRSRSGSNHPLASPGIVCGRTDTDTDSETTRPRSRSQSRSFMRRRSSASRTRTRTDSLSSASNTSKTKKKKKKKKDDEKKKPPLKKNRRSLSGTLRKSFSRKKSTAGPLAMRGSVASNGRGSVSRSRGIMSGGGGGGGRESLSRSTGKQFGRESLSRSSGKALASSAAAAASEHEQPTAEDIAEEIAETLDNLF